MNEGENTPNDAAVGTCLGMELDIDLDTIGVPLDAFVIVKSYVNGEPTYRIASTEALNAVEAMGMVVWAMELLKYNITARSEGIDEDEDEE